jgi:hypothetical protein
MTSPGHHQRALSTFSFLMNHKAKVFLVTVGLMAAGAVFGAIAGILALIIASALTESVSAVMDGEVLAIVGVVGAFFGGVLFPLAMWLVLRSVPLGLAVLGTVVGTALGGMAGWVLSEGHGNPISTAVWSAVAGFAIACVALRVGVPALGRRRVPAA